jgi:probable rRNA maturation factor
MIISFFFPEKKVPALKERTRLKGFINKLFQKEGFKLNSLNYIFCSDDYLLTLNQQHLQHDYYTDILTFDLSHTKKEIEGEIYISIDRVRDNAENHDKTFNNELHRVIFHGALHLCGYKDKTKEQEKKMRGKEDEWLALYFK